MRRMIEILEKEFEIYQEMLKISEEKTDIIVKDKVDELEEMTRREEEFVRQFIELEKERVQIVKNFAAEHGLGEKIIKIPELCEYFPEEKEELMGLRKEILAIVEKVKAKTELNEKLLKNSLEYINFSVGLATGTSASNGIYGQSGSTGKGEAKKFFDIKLYICGDLNK